MDRSKRLVVYYSRSGTTRKMAQALAKSLRSDLEEITEAKSRSGFLGYMRSAIEAVRQRPSGIAGPRRDVASYDLVIVGTPVWASSLSSPVRAYLTKTAAQIPEVAFFCCLGGRGSENAFAQMTAIVGKKPIACCAITQGQVQAGTYIEPLFKFEKLLNAMPTHAVPATA